MIVCSMPFQALQPSFEQWLFREAVPSDFMHKTTAYSAFALLVLSDHNSNGAHQIAKGLTVSCALVLCAST